MYTPAANDDVLLYLLASTKLIREEELDPKKQYIFGFHPHGIIVLSRVAWFGGCWEKLFPNITARRMYTPPASFPDAPRLTDL